MRLHTQGSQCGLLWLRCPSCRGPPMGWGGQEHYPPFVKQRVGMSNKSHLPLYFEKLLIAGFGFHQAWQWEPQPPINLDPYLQRCRPFRNPRSPTLPPVDFAPIQAHCSINRMPHSLTGVTDFSVLICRISKTRENAERNALLCV